LGISDLESINRKVYDRSDRDVPNYRFNQSEILIKSYSMQPAPTRGRSATLRKHMFCETNNQSMTLNNLSDVAKFCIDQYDLYYKEKFDRMVGVDLYGTITIYPSGDLSKQREWTFVAA